MGQYFRPVHKPTKTGVTNLPFAENGGLTWIPKIFYYDDSSLLECTQFVADKYDWSVDDIVWVGDYGQEVSITTGGQRYDSGCEDDDNELLPLVWG